MTETEKRVPEIRFKGFVDAWEQRKFSDYYKISSGFAFKLQDYEEIGVPIVNGESIQHGVISGNKFNYLPESFRNKYPQFILNAGDIVLGLNRPITNGELKIARIPNKLDKSLLYQRAGKIEYNRPINKEFSFVLLDKEIFKYTLKEAVGSDQPFISTTNLAKWKMVVPSSKNEMGKIGVFFNRLNEAIALHQRKLASLKQLKQSYLQVLFPQNKGNNPTLRFCAFSDSWEQRKLGELLSEVRRPIKMNDDEYYELVTVKRRNEGIVSRGLFKGNDVLVKSQFQIKTGDYLISKRQVVHGANGIVPRNLNNAIVSNEYLVSIGNKNVTTDFLSIISRRPDMYKKFFLSSYGIDIEKLVFNVEDWKKRTIQVPCVSEQNQISIFFKQLDNTIALHQYKLEKLLELKNVLLGKMFL